MRFTEILSKDSCPVCGQTPCNCTHVAEAVTLDRSRVPGYPQDPATIQHRLATAKEILSDPKSDPDSRKEAAYIVAQAQKQGAADDESLDENLRKWFKEKWVRFGPDGKIRGDCARGDDSEGKPKCLPQAKAHALGKKGRASAAARKRREDPNPERRGPAKNVATKKKSNEGVSEADKHSLIGKLKRGEELYGKVKSSFKDIGDAQKRGDSEAASKAFRKHERYANLRAPGTWTKVDEQGVAEGAEFGSNYAEQLAQQTFDIKPDLQDENEVLNLGYSVAVRELGSRARGLFRDDDFPSDFVSAYGWLQDRKQDIAEQQLDEKCWDGYHKEGNKELFGKTVPNCVKNESAVAETQQQCPECGGPMFPALILGEKQDACYYKVKSRYKVWPSAYASGALVQCRKKGAANWGNKK